MIPLRHALPAALASLLLLAAPGPVRAAAAAEETQGEQTYEQNEIVNAVANFFGMTTEAAAKVVERIFADKGKPNAIPTSVSSDANRF